MKTQKTQKLHQNNLYKPSKKEPKVIFSAIETIQALEIEEKSKAKRFRDNHKLEIITNGTIPISKQRPMLSPPQTPDFSPSIPRIAKVASFIDALYLRQWVENSQKLAQFHSLNLPMPTFHPV